MNDIAPHWVHEITPGAVGIWSLLAVVLVALIKAWPVLALQAQTAREKLRGEHRSDLVDCKERIDKLQTDLDRVKDTVNSLEKKLVGAVSAYRLLDEEVERHIPESAALKHARLLMRTAFEMAAPPETNFEPPRGFNDI